MLIYFFSVFGCNKNLDVSGFCLIFNMHNKNVAIIYDWCLFFCWITNSNMNIHIYGLIMTQKFICKVIKPNESLEINDWYVCHSSLKSNGMSWIPQMWAFSITLSPINQLIRWRWQDPKIKLILIRSREHVGASNSWLIDVLPPWKKLRVQDGMIPHICLLSSNL